MPKTRNKAINKILKDCEKQGFRVKGSGGHIKVFGKDGRNIVVISHSPKSTSTKKVLCDLKNKLGFVPR
jgi:hypothetical protein